MRKKAVREKKKIRSVLATKRPPRARQSADWIEAVTGKSKVEWVSLLQKEIKRASRPTKDPQHDATDPLVWVAKLAKVVHQSFPTRGRYDGNLLMAAVLGYVLLLWYFRCHRAKCYDPRRPIAGRRQALARWLECAAAVTALPLDESKDGEMFPGQKWESPFAWHATDGTFV